MNRYYGYWFSLVLLILFVGVTIPHEADANPSARSRFSHLTSEVWRFQGTFAPRDLSPVANNNPNTQPQPHRDKPALVALNAIGTKLYVTLQGTEAEPGHEVAVVDVASHKVIKRIPVGSRPYQPVLHPGGRYLVVTNELSNYVTVIDTLEDQAVGNIPLDYYAQGLVFSADGKTAWVAIRYLNQVLVLDIQERTGGLTGKVREIGGFDSDIFLGTTTLPETIKAEMIRKEVDETALLQAAEKGLGGINAILRARCGQCHSQVTGGFISGPDPVTNFLSAVENAIGGEPFASPLLRAVIPQSMGGFGDQRNTSQFHSGGVLFQPEDPDLAVIVNWIKRGVGGPGIPVGNPGSHPKDLVLSPDGDHLFVANTGTMDVSVVDVEAQREVGAVFIQNLTNFLTIYQDPKGEKDQLITLGPGIGFGAPAARDPVGGETWKRDHAAAQFTVLRDPVTTDAYPIEQQFVMGPFDAIDGTWNFKMRDIQNDLVAIDLSRLQIPRWQEDMEPDYILRANRYEAHSDWVRYTSDTAEATTGDIKGDIPPELQRVHGAFPEWATIVGDRLFVTMSGTFEVVEWQIDSYATDPSMRLTPVRRFTTGLRPMGIVAGVRGPADKKLFVANNSGETITIIDLADNKTHTVVVGDLSRPAPDTDVERGELVVHTTRFSSDGDTSCVHCHYRDTGDGRGWGAAETIGQDHDGHLTPGGTLGIPQMKNLFAIQPFYFEGTHRLSEGQGADINEPASSIDFDRPIWAGDFSKISSPIPSSERRLMHEELKERVEVRKLGPIWHDLEERRDVFLRQQSLQTFGGSYDLADLYRFVAAWMGNTTHLFPQPYDLEHPSVQRGKALFNSQQVMCGVCHTAPEFTNKSRELADNDRRALPTLTTVTRRGASYTLVGVHALERANGRSYEMEPEDPGRVESKEGSFTTMQLRGIFDRPPVFLHHGRARSLREVLLTPGHPAARRYRLPVLQGGEEVRPDRLEIGLNEVTPLHKSGRLIPTQQIFDTHGGTSHLSSRQIEDLLNFIKTIQ